MSDVKTTDTEEARFLEALAVSAWPPATREELAGWELSFDRGVTRRANSTLPNRLAAQADPKALIATVEQRYRARGLRPCFKISPAAAPADLDRRLAARGYSAEGHSLVLTAEPEGVARRAAPAPGVTLQMLEQPDQDWSGACWPDAGLAEDEARSALAGRIESPRAFALARIEGQPAGAAAIACRSDWACITAVNTPAAWRRRGVAWTLMAGLADWACRQGAEGLYLQVEVDNGPARALYERLGFEEAYPYHYRRLA